MAVPIDELTKDGEHLRSEAFSSFLISMSVGQAMTYTLVSMSWLIII